MNLHVKLVNFSIKVLKTIKITLIYIIVVKKVFWIIILLVCLVFLLYLIKKKIFDIYLSLTSKGAVFCGNIEDHIRRFKNVLQQLTEIVPQDNIDGVKNIWIVKPGAKSRGRGNKILFQFLYVFVIKLICW